VNNNFCNFNKIFEENYHCKKEKKFKLKVKQFKLPTYVNERNSLHEQRLRVCAVQLANHNVALWQTFHGKRTGYQRKGGMKEHLLTAGPNVCKGNFLLSRARFDLPSVGYLL
jgi:hypothetical protein